MRRPSRILVRLAFALVALLLLLLVVLLLIPDTAPPAPPPLPFDTNGYATTTSYEIFPTHLPTHASFKTRVSFVYFKLWDAFHQYHLDPTSTTFATNPVMACSIQGLLNQCMQASGTRYLMPPDIATGTVRFGNSKVLNGRQWIAAFEAALETNRPSFWDGKTKSRHSENLVLIRYPKQKTVLVLTATEAAEFRRTNSTGIIDKEHR
jgi:hypothetical protein